MMFADHIVINANVFTGDPDKPGADAVAVKGNRIVYVGDNAGTETWRGVNTRIFDGKSRTLTAGFIDSHVHLLSGAMWMGHAELREVRSKDELKQTLLDFADKAKTEQWIGGRGIRYNIVSTGQELDEIISDRPVYIGAFEGHTAWVNTKALEMAGILHDDKRAMANGIIVREESGLASGELRESDAMSTVFDLIPTPDANRKRELLKLAIHEFNKTGITSVHNMNGDMEELMAYADLVLFSHDLFALEPENIRSAKAVMTMIDGRVVHESD